MLQQIIKVGNSLAVTLPAKFTKQLGLNAGEKIRVIPNPEQKIILITTEDNTEGLSNLTPEFFSWLEETKASQSDLIKRLAKA